MPQTRSSFLKQSSSNYSRKCQIMSTVEEKYCPVLDQPVEELNQPAQDNHQAVQDHDSPYAVVPVQETVSDYTRSQIVA